MCKNLFIKLTCLLALLSTYSNLLAADDVLSLQQAVTIAKQQNPGLKQMQASAEAMAAIPSQQGSLPDPVISFGLANLPVDSFSTSQEAMTQWQMGVSQQLPYPGKLALKAETASYLAQASAFSVDEFRQQLIADVKTLWWRLFYLDKVIHIVGLNKTLLKQFIDIAQTKYEVGQGLQQDVLLAQLELSKLIDRELQLHSGRDQEQARLNALLNRAADSPVTLADSDSATTVLANIKPVDTLYTLAEQQRALLSRQRELVSAAQSEKHLAERNLLPDFKLSAGYGIRQGQNMDGSDRSDFMSVQLGVTVPIFAERKQKMAISQKNSELKQQQFALQDEWLQVKTDISTQLRQYQQAQQQQELLQSGIIPQARQTVASMLAGYQVNKVDFLNLVRAQITLYNYETNLWQIVSHANSALAALQASVGEENIYE